MNRNRENVTRSINAPELPNSDPERSNTLSNNAQPNVLAAAPDAVVMTVKMWAMVFLTGIGAGLTSGLLMKLLRLAQHLSFSYSTGDFLTGVRHTSGEHRIIVVSLGGLVAGLSLYLLRPSAITQKRP